MGAGVAGVGAVVGGAAGAVVVAGGAAGALCCAGGTVGVVSVGAGVLSVDGVVVVVGVVVVDVVVSVLSVFVLVSDDALRLTGTNVVRRDDDVTDFPRTSSELVRKMPAMTNATSPVATAARTRGRGMCSAKRPRSGVVRCTRRWAAAAAGTGAGRACSRSSSRSPARPSATGS